MGKPRDGILLVDKDEGESSFGVVKKIKGALGIKKVGHAGTLDPFATGLLIILLGQGTKLAPYLMSGRKTYRGILQLGVETDTQDPTGQRVSTRPVPEFSLEEIQKAASGFMGEIEQVPPAFSAVRYQGKRAYTLARKGIRMELKGRKVRIYALEILDAALPEVTFQVVCSGGTYVRTLAADLGRRMGPGAYLKVLRRLRSAPFLVQDAVKSAWIGSRMEATELEGRMIPLRNALPEMQELQTSPAMAERIRKGYQPRWKELTGGPHRGDVPGTPVKIVRDQELVAIATERTSSAEDGILLKIQRVFV